MELDSAMELSFWKEEPLSPFTGLVEEEADIWELFGDVKQDEQEQEDPLDDSGKQEAWLPDSPSDSCDSLSPSTKFSARARLASQILEDLDVIIKEESFSDWYESKTDLPMFEELPSPTPSLCKEDALAGVASRPFAGLSLTGPQFASNVAVFAPAAPSAVHVPLSAVQQHHTPTVGSLQQLEQRHGVPQAPQAPQAPLVLPHAAPAIGPLTTAHMTLADTETLLQEFESVYGKVEQSHGGALTPPQSPPQSPPRSPLHHIHHHYSAPTSTNAVAFAYQQQQQQPQLHQVPVHPEFSGNLLVTIPQQEQQQQQQQLLELDEIVRSRVQAEEAWPSTSFAPPSPCTSSNSSCSFTSEEPAPASPETDDPDWVPEASPVAEPRDAPAPGKATAASRSKRGQGRRKPYGVTVEDKRQRKKEQNKNAATRYRMKKKAEVEVIVGEENELKDKNDELQAKVADLSQEIRYLKNLMRDLFRARGLIK